MSSARRISFRAWHRAAAIAVLVLLMARPSIAGEGPALAGAWWSLGVLAGSTLPDGRLANYRWDVRPRAAWGAQALAGRSRSTLGLRVWQSNTVQVLDLPSGPVAPAVRSTALEVVARFQLLSLAGAGVWAGASAGRLGIDYRPDHIVISSGGPGGDVVAELSPLHEWTSGAGLGVTRTVSPRWRLGLAFDRRFFSLDTAHRAGSAVVNQRESFGDWSARLELAWQHPLTLKGVTR